MQQVLSNARGLISLSEWRVLYVILTSFMLVVFILSVSWTFICCCKRWTHVCRRHADPTLVIQMILQCFPVCRLCFRRRQTKVRKKTKYTILDNMDEQERVELRPKFSESLQLERLMQQQHKCDRVKIWNVKKWNLHPESQFQRNCIACVLV